MKRFRLVSVVCAPYKLASFLSRYILYPYRSWARNNPLPAIRQEILLRLRTCSSFHHHRLYSKKANDAFAHAMNGPSVRHPRAFALELTDLPAGLLSMVSSFLESHAQNRISSRVVYRYYLALYLVPRQFYRMVAPHL